MPPTAPARRNNAVRSGFRIRITTAVPNVIALLTLTVRMLLPLPGSSGHQCEHTPITNPAPAIEGINTHERFSCAGRAHAIRRLKPSPTATASGDTATANTVNTTVTDGAGQASGVASWVTSEAAATPRLEVISAVPSTRGCHDRNRIRAANNAPPTGTLYTAPSPAPAAHASRISRSRAVRAHRDVPRSPMATANWRGAPSRPSDAPDPTSSTCKPASTLSTPRGIGLCDRIESVSAGTSTRRRSNHQPSPASAPPTIGPTTRRTGLLPVTPSSSEPNE